MQGGDVSHVEFEPTVQTRTASPEITCSGFHGTIQIPHWCKFDRRLRNMFSIQDDCGVLVALISVAGILGGTYLGALLNRKTTTSTALMMAKIESQRHLDRRLWDTRKESYSLILLKLTEARKYADYMDDGYSSDGELHPEVYHASEEREKHQRRNWAAWSECKSEFDKNHLVLSADFVIAFQELVDDLATISEHDMLPYIAPRQAEYFRNAHTRLLQLAKDEFASSRSELHSD